MGLMDKITKAFNLDNDDYYDDDDYDIDDDYDEPEERPSKVKHFVSRDKEEDDEPKEEKGRTNVLSYKKTKAGNNHGQGICIIKPSVFDDGREIVDTLRSRRAVVLNLEGMETEIAQRIIDFASGACYSMDGTLQKVSAFIFIIAPANVDVAGDIPEFLAESGIKF